jgi:HK97 family phage portal protein
VAVLACLIVRAETFSALPFDVYYKNGLDRISDESDPAYRLFAIAPNDIMNAGEFWRWKQLREDVTGNAYAHIIWNGYDPVEIWPLTGANPSVVINRTSHSIVYDYAGDDFTPAGPIPPRDMLHFKGPVLRTPYEGKSLIDLAGEEIGIALGSSQFFSRMLSNGNHFPGYLETDQTLEEEDITAITDQLKGVSGLLSAGQLRIFDRGLHYKQNSMTLKDAELIEQMRWQLQQICSVFRVPMAFVQDLSTGTYTNSEQQDLWLGKHTITPICVNSQRVLRHRIWPAKPAYYGKFNLEGLLRGDFPTRTEGEAKLVNAGIVMRNEVRSIEDYNQVPGLSTPIVQGAMATVNPDGTINSPKPAAPAPVAPVHAPTEPVPVPRPTPAAQTLLEPVLFDAMDCIRRRYETDQAKAISRRDKALARQDTIDFATNKLAPIAEAYALAGLRLQPERFVKAILGKESVVEPPAE